MQSDICVDFDCFCCCCCGRVSPIAFSSRSVLLVHYSNERNQKIKIKYVVFITLNTEMIILLYNIKTEKCVKIVGNRHTDQINKFPLWNAQVGTLPILSNTNYDYYLALRNFSAHIYNLLNYFFPLFW